MKKHHVIYSLFILILLAALGFSTTACANDSEAQTALRRIAPRVTPQMALVAETVQLESDSWKLILASEKSPLPDDFTAKVSKLPNGKEFDSRAIDDLEAMLAAAKADGVSLTVVSSYRSYDYQVGLFKRKVDQYKAKGYNDTDAYNIAKTIVALPGTSEHNLGLAADIVTPSYMTLDDGFEKTDAFAWLSTHCADYGFILRYPKDKGDITGIIYEPWHYRYVGHNAAKEIMAKGICLEEYLGKV